MNIPTRAALTAATLLFALYAPRLPAADGDSTATQTPAYIQLHRDVLINADLWSDKPEILAANYGFEGIIGVPGLLDASDLDQAIAAGAGVNLDWAALDPAPPLRNLTSGAGVAGVAVVGFGATPVLADAMPIEVSWPLLPSSVSPDNIAITLNTGATVTPEAAALNPNYDHNERHVIVVFGEFGNRLLPGEPSAIYPVAVTFVPGSAPLMAVGPDGPVSIVGLSAPSSNPYLAGPALVGAILSRFSPAGDFPPPSLANAFPNDAYSQFGEEAEYRLRLFTSGGFSPDGVSGFLPTDFETFFRLHAQDSAGNAVILDQVGQSYDLGVGQIEIIGLAELGAPATGALEPAYYAEDHDNYFDIVMKGDEAALRRLEFVEIPGATVPGYSNIYNPGGPGRSPQPGTTYTEPGPAQRFPIAQHLDDPRTINYAAQTLASYDLDDDLPVVFHLRAAGHADILTSSSRDASALIDHQGFALVAVEFANETARPGVSDVHFYVSDSGDHIYTLDATEQAQLDADAHWTDRGRAFGAFDRPWPGLAPIYRFYDTTTEQHFFTPDLNQGQQQANAEYQGIAWYAALFVAPAPAPGPRDDGDSGGGATLFWLAGALLWWRSRKRAAR